MLESLLSAYLITCAIEFPFIYFFVRASLEKKILVLLAINLVTLPLLWLLLPYFFQNYLLSLAVAELGIALFEAWLIKKAINSRNALRTAIAMNFASAAIGFFLF